MLYIRYTLRSENTLRRCDGGVLADFVLTMMLLPRQELELEWEGVRDLTAIVKALKNHKSLTRLNLTHNEVRVWEIRVWYLVSYLLYLAVDYDVLRVEVS